MKKTWKLVVSGLCVLTLALVATAALNSGAISAKNLKAGAVYVMTN